MTKLTRNEAEPSIEIERAIAEIRGARPVLLRDASTEALIFAADGLEPRDLARLEQSGAAGAHLVLTPARLRRLGVERPSASFVALPALDIRRIQTLAGDPNARLDAPVTRAPALYESALQLLRLAHVLPAALILPVSDEGAIGALVARAEHVDGYRSAATRRLRIVSRAPVPLDGAPNSEFILFRGGEGLRDQVAIVVDAPDLSAPVTVRLHSACLTGDLFGSLKCDCGDQLRQAARHMAENGGGLLLYLDQEGRGNGLSSKIRAYGLQAHGFDTFDADEILGFEEDGRSFGFAAEILKQLGVTQVRLMTNNPHKISALEAAGLVVASDHRVVGRRNAHNVRYLAAKRDRAGHLLD